MITVKPGKYMNKYYGVSSDDKPTDQSVLNASSFYEMDTGDSYMYDRANGLWISQSGESGGTTPSGGGNGGSDQSAGSGEGNIFIIHKVDKGIASTVLDKTWREIFNAVKDGAVPIVQLGDYEDFDLDSVDPQDPYTSIYLNWPIVDMWYRAYDPEYPNMTGVGYCISYYTANSTYTFSSDSPDGELENISGGSF